MKIQNIKPSTRRDSTFAGLSKDSEYIPKDVRTGSNLPNSPARTRFAPSPTGYMHIGGLRTALFSYLLAKKTGGQFILRIEDTDSKRFVADAEQRLCEDLQWAGLEWDEGPQVGGQYGPYKQSERNHIYQEYVKILLDNGSAYRCFCTSTNVNVGKVAFSTGGCHQNCSSLPADQAEERAVDGKESFTTRLRPSVMSKIRAYPDLVYGNVRRLKRSPSAPSSGDGEDSGMDASDPVLIKSDGIPTYHFANVVDDHLMKITHVIRGSEWLASLPLHYDLYGAFDWQPPLFAHVGLLVDQSGAKLSKRSNNAFALDIPTLRGEQGILPETLRNYLALLGWSNPAKGDVMSLSELIERFDLKFTKGNAVVTPNKLWFLQKWHVFGRCMSAREKNSLEPIQLIVEAIETELLALHSASDLHTRGLPLQSYIAEVLLIDGKDYTTAIQYVSRNQHFFRFDRAQVPKTTTSPSDELHLFGSETPESFISKVLLNFDFTQPYRATKFAAKIAEASSDGIHTSIDTSATKIHAALSHATWRTMLEQASLPIDEEVLGFSSLGQRKDSRAQLAGYIATQLGDASMQEEVLAQHKGWTRIVMAVLREKLCYGLPGPGMGHAMAVLGWEECCRRMELDVKEGTGKGW